MIVQWMSVLGITGFLCGFVGPMLLAPDANQGPMAGIFITGPGGAILGAALGGMVRLLSWPSKRSRQALYACSILLAIVTLYFCIPSPRYQADVVEGEIHSCVPADSLREKTIASLNQITATHRNAKPINWSEKFDCAIGEKPGVVITLHLARHTRVFEKQALWNRGDLMIKPWLSSNKDIDYFATYSGTDCTQYPIGIQTILTATGNIGIWPAYGIAEMLNVKSADLLPAKYAQLIATDNRSR